MLARSLASLRDLVFQAFLRAFFIPRSVTISIISQLPYHWGITTHARRLHG